MVTLIIFFLNRSFLDIVEKNEKPVFFKIKTKFQIYRLYKRDSDWLNFINFSGYKYNVRLISIL